MFGKHFESMYDGSMYGAGLAVFAVWGWIISHARAGVVELNPKRLADTLGGKEEEVQQALEYLQRPDPHSRFKACEGKRLVKEGEYQYRLPSWEYYQKIRSELDRREYNRQKQREHRERMIKGDRGEIGQKDVEAHVESGRPMADERMP